MRAVWSYWSVPHDRERGHVWTSERHHLLSWVLSLETARRHHPETALYTDSAGARKLVDGVGLEFGEVSTALDALAEHDPHFWAMGKLYAYREQTAPFVHVDSDVFLWSPLPERLLQAPVFTQNPELFDPGTFYYRPERVEEWLLSQPGAWLPPEWMWFLRSGLPLRGDCAGILGGCDTDFLRHYADAAIRVVEHRGNARGWARIGDRELDVISVEQFLLSACVEYHARWEESPFPGVRMEHLFSSFELAFVPGIAESAGYTHLIAGSKRDPDLSRRLEARVASEYPEQYERCLRYLRDEGVEDAPAPPARRARSGRAAGLARAR